MREKFYRGLFYTAGMLLLALGITLNTKTGLGVTPIVSVATIGCELWGFSFGNMTLAIYVLFVAGEFLLRGRNSKWFDLLQIPLSIVFTRFLDIYAAVITYDSTQHSFAANLILLACAITLTGLGVSLTVNMRLIPNPGDGIVQAIAERMGWSQGFAKNVLDTACVCITVVLGLAFFGRIIAISIGTVLAMIFIGRVVALSDWLFKAKICTLSGVAVKKNS